MEDVLQPPKGKDTRGRAKGRVGHPGAPPGLQDALGAGFSVAIQNFLTEIKTWQDLQVSRDPSKSLLLFYYPNSSVLT